MPNGNPQLGETWADPNGTTGVIVAEGRDVVRLVSRLGRRVNMARRTLVRLWHMEHPAPEPRICSAVDCDSIAYFRREVEGEEVWICEDHIPNGQTVCFPADSISRADTQVECPLCRALTVERGSTVSSEMGRSYIQNRCTSCQALWYTILGRGGGDDGHIFAEDIVSLADVFDIDYQVSAYIGSIANRSMARATGMRSDHIQGVDLVETDAFGDNIVLVIGTPYRPDEENQHETPDALNIQLGSQWRLKATGYISRVTQRSRSEVTLQVVGNRGFGPTPTEVITLPVRDLLRDYEPYDTPIIPEHVIAEVNQRSYEMFDEEEVVVGTIWRRIRNDNEIVLCEVDQVQDDYVRYHITFNGGLAVRNDLRVNPNPPMLVRQFKEHWTLVRGASDLGPVRRPPDVGSFWRSLENREVFRVASNSGSQVQLLSLDPNLTSKNIGLTNLQRLYKHLPFPPTKVPWSYQGHAFSVVHVPDDILESNGNLRLNHSISGEYREVDFHTFLKDYNFISFQDRILSDQRLRTGAKWRLHGEEVEIVDIGTSENGDYVRFSSPDHDWRLYPINTFRREGEFIPDPCPTAIGEEWMGKLSSGEEIVHTVVKILEVESTVELEYYSKGEGPYTIDIAYYHLTSEFTKLERKNRFQVLDEEDDF